MYFNDIHNIPPPVFDVDFSDGHSNSRLSNSDGMTAGGNYMMPPDHQMHTEGSKVQSRYINTIIHVHCVIARVKIELRCGKILSHCLV